MRNLKQLTSDLKQLKKGKKRNFKRQSYKSYNFGEEQTPNIVSPNIISPNIVSPNIVKKQQSLFDKIKKHKADIAKIALLTAAAIGTGALAYKGGKAIKNSETGKLLSGAVRNRYNDEKAIGLEKINKATGEQRAAIENLHRSTTAQLTKRGEQVATATAQLETAIKTPNKHVTDAINKTAAFIDPETKKKLQQQQQLEQQQQLQQLQQHKQQQLDQLKRDKQNSDNLREKLLRESETNSKNGRDQINNSGRTIDRYFLPKEKKKNSGKGLFSNFLVKKNN